MNRLKRTGTRTRKRIGGTKKAKTGKRTIYCQDAIPWLEKQEGLDAIVTSIPEMDEMKMTFKEYIPFFRNTARRCLEAVKETGYCIFLQTDRKYKGWVDKSYLITGEAEALGMRLLWHKIALRVEVGKTDLYRPGYSHMLCYSKKGKIGIPTADVVHRGEVTYPNAFGMDAVRHVVGYLKKQGVKSVVDPFVGSGTVVAIANALGMKAVGVDIDKVQCEKARKLVLSAEAESDH
jgi:hypothetical protein